MVGNQLVNMAKFDPILESLSMWQRNFITLPSGTRVRYSLLKRNESEAYNVRFKDAAGRRLERSTGTMKKAEAIERAHNVIQEEYQQVGGPSSPSVPWPLAMKALEDAMTADGKRPKTIKGYLETLGKLIKMFPLTVGPADVSERMANEFKTKYASTRFTRKQKLKEGEQAEAFPRKAKSLDSRIRTLKAVFAWFKTPLLFVSTNPFENVSQPELDRNEVKYVRQSDISDFFAWLEKRYPGWAMPQSFFSVKALTGCRLEDICSLRSAQLQDGRLVFPADSPRIAVKGMPLFPRTFTAIWTPTKATPIYGSPIPPS